MTHHGQKGPAGGETEQTKDPVCGMTVAADTPHKMEHGGKNYLFCSPGCMEKFRREPARYGG